MDRLAVFEEQSNIIDPNNGNSLLTGGEHLQDGDREAKRQKTDDENNHPTSHEAVSLTLHFEESRLSETILRNQRAIVEKAGLTPMSLDRLDGLDPIPQATIEAKPETDPSASPDPDETAGEIKLSAQSTAKLPGSQGYQQITADLAPSHVESRPIARAQAPSEVVTKYVTIPDLPRRVPALPKPSPLELQELEVALQLDPSNKEEWWKDDWSGNLALLYKEVSNPKLKRRSAQKTEMTMALWEWAQQPGVSHVACQMGRLLLAHCCSMAPPTAQRILGLAYVEWDKDPGKFDIYEAVNRCTYDPSVLKEDGWTTSPVPENEVQASGGPAHIGKHITWEGFEAVVIAYLHDDDFGDLWKGMYLDEHDTFDLEAEELQKAIRRWERKQKRLSKGPESTESSAVSARFAAVKDFSVEGIEHGIVLATTYNPNARQGVFWPARILHVSELDKTQSQNKRNSAKQKVSVVFLSPYWTNDSGAIAVGGRTNGYSSYPLFQIESIDVSESTIQKYPYDCRRGLNIHQLRIAFRFTGLPKNAFGRFFDGHRLAIALKMYAQDELVTPSIKLQNASAALFDTHPLAIKTARFPAVLLNLPYRHILSRLKTPGKEPNVSSTEDEEDTVEPVVRLAYILKSMEPPRCFGGELGGEETRNGSYANENVPRSSLASPAELHISRTESANSQPANFLEELQVINLFSSHLTEELNFLAQTDRPPASLRQAFEQLVARCNRVVKDVNANTTDREPPNLKLKSLLQECLRMKSYGEDALASDGSLLDTRINNTLVEWRKACERLFKHVTLRCSRPGFGNGVTVVLSDSRCNKHVTKNGCVERPVRLPAALKAARQAGAGSSPSFSLQVEIEDKYIILASEKFLEKAHTASYLKKMRIRCTGLAPDMKGANLTEASDGEGGCDTTGSRGTYDAAVAGVAAAMKAADMIVGGQCVNAFCATRPPGHHAGRDLHPMGAVSNGFCILNPVACAAIYATTPLSEGGLGLKRAVVIDFDVHHGNGTQDILCSTNDPRFLYVSMHAGGADINGYESDDSDMDFGREGSKKQEGIYPGRCGDTSPHRGVINLPLGAKVMPHDIGNALVSVVEPAVEAFAPDIVILSAGFDGHKNDPLGMGGLSALDFGHITEVACGMAFRYCSGRIMSVLEGGYGVPCCRAQDNLFLPKEQVLESQPLDQSLGKEAESSDMVEVKRLQPSKLLELDDFLPDEMDDQVTPGMQRKLERCHAEGFVDCVREHVSSLWHNNSRS